MASAIVSKSVSQPPNYILGKVGDSQSVARLQMGAAQLGERWRGKSCVQRGVGSIFVCDLGLGVCPTTLIQRLNLACTRRAFADLKQYIALPPLEPLASSRSTGG